MNRFSICSAPLVFVLTAAATARSPAEAPHKQARLRRPVAMVLVDDGQTLLVANRDSGSVSVVAMSESDGAPRGEVVAEYDVGRRLADMAALADGRRLLVVDEQQELIELQRSGNSFKVRSRTTIRHTPVSVALLAGGRSCAVASLWSRQLTLVDLSGDKPQPRTVIDLPFAPRKQLLLPDGRTLLVADAFGGALALVDSDRGELIRIRDVEGHNLRGLAISPDGRRLLITHQMLDPGTGTTRFAVHWGAVMRNVVRTVYVDALLGKPRDRNSYGTTNYFGIPDAAAGDPEDLVVAKTGVHVVAYGGVSEVAVSHDGVSFAQRVEVGRRPTALLLTADHRHVLAADMFDDSISVVRLSRPQLVGTIRLGPQPPLSPAAEGELLFYDARLARDGWFSCHSCHTDGHSNGNTSDNFSDGSFDRSDQQYGSGRRNSPGGAKRVLSLLGTGYTGPWAWNGSMGNLPAQIRKSVEITMQGKPISEEKVAALEAYLRTLQSPPGLARARGQVDPSLVERGSQVFQRQGCTDCHPKPQFTSAATYDVGLVDAGDNRQFNPPSLRGVSQRRRLLHDGRAADVREVLTNYDHPSAKQQLSTDDLEALVAYLGQL